MISPVITVRPFGKDITYLPPETQLLSASVICEQGNGSPGDPYQLCIQVKNDGDVPWRGVIRVSLPVDAPSPRFFLPGFMYGTNRGEAPLTVDSKCPRLREDGDFLASAWWMVRSDRLSQPCAFAYGNGRLTGFAAAPYYVRCDSWQKAWETGMRGNSTNTRDLDAPCSRVSFGIRWAMKMFRGFSLIHISIIRARRWTKIASA